MRAAAALALLVLILAVTSLASYSSAQQVTFNGCSNPTCGIGCPSSGYSTSSCSSTQTYTCTTNQCSTSCNLCASVTTNYQSNANYQFQTSSSPASPATTSPVASINNYNIYSTGWFLTCPEPLAPGLGDTNPADNSLFYPYTKDGQFQYIGGDGCLATTTPLTSIVDLPVTLSWTVGPTGAQYASTAVQPLSIIGSSNLALSQEAYSPQLGSGSGAVIPSSFTVNSYIFQQVPAIAQNDIWTWSAPFAYMPGSQVGDTQTANSNPTIQFNEQETEAVGSLSGASNSVKGGAGIALAGTASPAGGKTANQLSLASACSGSCISTDICIGEGGTCQGGTTCSTCCCVFGSASTTSTSTTTISSGPTCSGAGGTCLPASSCSGICDSECYPRAGACSVASDCGASSKCCTCAGGAASTSSTTSTTAIALLPLSAGPITPTSPTINLGSSITLTANPSGGTPQYSYQWYSDGVCGTSIGGGSASITVAPTTTTVYSYKVTDSASPAASACSPGDTVTVVEKYVCQYKYAYSETTTLKSVQSQQLPFNEVNVLADTSNPNNPPKITYSSFLTPILPYFTLQYSMQALDSQWLHDSYDVFGPWSYNTPTNSIEMFPIDTPSQFLFNYQTSQGSMLLYGPSGSLKGISQLNNLLGNLLNLLGNLVGGGNGNKNGVHKTLAKFGLQTPYISSPLSIAEISNDYIFVLNYSDPAHGGNNDYYLSVLRLIPKGYFNTTSDQPNSVPAVVQTTTNGATSIQDCQTNPDGTFGNCVAGSASTPKQEWLNNWNGYWANVIDAQNSSVYVVRSIDLGSGQGSSNQDKNSYYLAYYLSQVTQPPSCSTGACQTIDTFVPYNLTADSRGDVFIVGYAVDSTGGTGGNGVNYPGIVEIPVANGPSAPTPASDKPDFTYGDWSVSGQTPPLTEIAMTSDGTWLYASNQSSGTIYQFSANTNPIAQSEAVGLAFSTIGNPGTIQSATQSGVQSSLDIAAYIEQGGLYGIPFNGYGPYWSMALAPTGSPANPNNEGLSSDFDTNVFHHVIGMTNVNGYIYVLDDWRGYIGYQDLGKSIIGTCWNWPPWQCTKYGTNFDILMLRVLDSSGGSVPINPTQFNDLYTTQGCAVTYCSVNQNPCPSQYLQNSYTPSSCIPTSAQNQVYPECSPSSVCWQASTGCTAAGGQTGTREFCAAVGGTSAGSSSYYALSSPGFFASQGGQVYPPYGWVLSANITPSSNSGDYPIGFCSSYGSTPISSGGGVLPSCQFNPQNVKSQCEKYENPADWANCQWSPIGPALNAKHSDLTGTGFSESLNGTLTLLFKTNTVCTGIVCGCLLGICGSPNAPDPLYNELISTMFSVENYTKYFDGNIGYSCYTDSSNDGGVNGACGLLGATGTDYLASMIPPVFSTTNPFRYLESLGSQQTLTLTGAGATSVSGGQACTGTATASGCTYGKTDSGPPTLTISAYPGNWNKPDTISLITSGNSESQNDNLELYITDSSGNPIPGSQACGPDGKGTACGLGAVSYTICTSGPCLAPASGSAAYKVWGEDTATGDTVPSGGSGSPETLTIQDIPSITLQSPQLITCATQPCPPNPTSESTEAITVQDYTNGGTPDSITFSITDSGNNPVMIQPADLVSCQQSGGKQLALSGPVSSVTCQGTIQYTESDLQASGSPYAITASDNGGAATATLLVQPSSASAASTGGAETLASTLKGYVLIPYEYTYSLTQSWTNPQPSGGTGNSGVVSGGDGDESCTLPPPNFPSSPQTTQADVFSYALTNGQSNMLSAIVEGGPSYLKESTNNNYYIANLTDANLVLPPQILYNVQNDRLFGTIWANATYCDTQQASGSVCTSYAKNNQVVLNATVQQQYSISTYGIWSGCVPNPQSHAQIENCLPYGGYETFSSSPITGQVYGGSLITGDSNRLAHEQYTSGQSNTQPSGGVSVSISQSPVTIRNPVTIIGTTSPGDGLELLVGGYCVSGCPAAPPTTPTTTAITPIAFTVSSSSCGSASGCSAVVSFVTAGTYQVEAQDLTNGQSQTATLVVLPQQIGFSYQNNPLFTSVPLFDLYKQVVFSSPLYLLLNGTQYRTGSTSGNPLRGYQQLVYVMNDRFNNLIYAPVEADVAEPIQITLNVQAAPSVDNPNQTTITINGVAGSYTSLGSVFQPLPEGQQIYLYYNDNLNFVDYSPLSQSTVDSNGQTISAQGATLTQQQAAESCAFATPGEAAYLNCVQSNPVYTGTLDNRVTNVGVATYAPSYNAFPDPNTRLQQCNQPTQGLLEPQYFECNVKNNPEGAALSSVCPNTGALDSCSQQYQQVALCLSTCWSNHGAAGCPATPAGISALTDPQSYCSAALPSTYTAYLGCAKPASYTSGSPQFCEQTDFSTGNGICTSQLGLIDANPNGVAGTTPSVSAPIVNTNGDFGPVTITACGSRSDQIKAVYYGWPPPEPIQVTQLPLAFAASAVNGNGCVGTCSQFLSSENPNQPSTLQTEYNYALAPTQTSQPVQIGIFQLSYNDVGIAATLAAMATTLLLLFWRELLPRRSGRR